jgi:hypothetical protein
MDIEPTWRPHNIFFINVTDREENKTSFTLRKLFSPEPFDIYSGVVEIDDNCLEIALHECILQNIKDFFRKESPDFKVVDARLKSKQTPLVYIDVTTIMD